MADDDTTTDPSAETPQSDGVEAEEAGTQPAPARKTAARKAPAKKAAAKKAATKKTPAKKAAAKKTAASDAADTPDESLDQPLDLDAETEASPPPARKTARKAAAKKAPAKKAATKRAPAKRTTTTVDPSPEPLDVTTDAAAASGTETDGDTDSDTDGARAAASGTTTVLFQTPTATTTTRTRRRSAATKPSEPDSTAAPVDGAAPVPEPVGDTPADEPADDQTTGAGADGDDESTSGGSQRSGRSRGGRGRGRGGSGSTSDDDKTGNDKAGDDKTGNDKAGDDKTGNDKAGDDTSDDKADTSGSDNDDDDESDDSSDGGQGNGRRRRRRGGRRRRRGGGDGSGSDSSDQGGQSGGDDDHDARTSDQQGNGKGSGNGNGDKADDGDDSGSGSGSSRRRRRRRREGDDAGNGGDDPSNTTTRVRRSRSPEDEITAISGSTRLEAKKQRRRDGREAGRRRAPIVSEAEFLSRRESVERVMTIRQRDDLTQIGVLEDKVLVEHYVARESQTSLIGNVYLGRVQNVLPSMEAAFIDIGKGRNAVLYAGEVNWSALGHKDGAPRKIESVLSSGQTILVQVSKDPIGHKGARLTSQISLAGRFLVYVPDGTTSGISRKLPDTERSRLKTLLKEIVPDSAGVIVRTAAEGASEEELTSDVERLKARWEDIEAKAAKSGGTAKSGGNPQLLYGEPDLTLKVVRDLFTEDFAKLVVQGDTAWQTVSEYVAHVAPDLQERLERHDGDADLFSVYRVDEQIAKALDRKVWLPSGGSLVIDRTEAMTVVDVNTGKFTGSGGNLEETVTKNNLEAAEEVVRQLRLRDIGGIIVVDFIDMVLESNRDLVLRRLVECLGRDRTRHQVAEVTSLGLVQMTRKRIGTGLLEAFSENCSHCHGYGVVVHDAPVEPKHGDDDSRGGGGGGRRRGGRGRSQDSDHGSSGNGNGGGNGQGGGRGGVKPTPAEFAAMVKSDSSHADQGGTDAGAESTVPASDRSSDELAEKASEKSAEQSNEKPAEQPSDETPSAPSTTVSTRTRGGGSRSARRSQPAPTSEPAAAEPEPAAEPATSQVPDPAPESTPESTTAAPEEQPEPASEVDSSPRVVTRSRRGVSRTVATAAPVTPVVPESTPAAPQAAVEPQPASSPEPPKVSTRTRGRRSPATSTPPAAVGDVGSPARSGAVEPAEVDVEPGGDSPLDQPLADSTEHVPVKRRTRRR